MYLYKENSHIPRKDIEKSFKIALHPVSYGKGQEKYKSHDPHKYGYAPHRMGQGFVNLIRAVLAFFPVKQHFVYDLFNMGIFGLNDLFFIIVIGNIGDLHRMLISHILIVLQKLDGVPAHGRMGRIMCLHHHGKLGDLVLYFPAVMEHVPL